MHLLGILQDVAPLLILMVGTSISIATPLSPIAAAAIKSPQTLSKGIDHVTIHGLTLRRSSKLPILLPIQIAASAFESLYQDLYQRAETSLSGNVPLSPSFTLTYRSLFEIHFITNDVERLGIPWEFVREFAILMKDMTLRGYTGCYDQAYWSDVGGFGVFIGLRILVPMGLMNAPT